MTKSDGGAAKKAPKLKWTRSPPFWWYASSGNNHYCVETEDVGYEYAVWKQISDKPNFGVGDHWKRIGSCGSLKEARTLAETDALTARDAQ